uniref:Cyclin-dependent kinases regulatory subunit n=1 Tax=Gouania willdenowi TaxID=441366 RepID=A0A8C5DQ60_GOUWI
MSHKQIYYSDKYDDEKYEYRHVMLPKDIAKRVPKTHLMSETEWRNLGVQQSQGWVHYMIHQPGINQDFICSHIKSKESHSNKCYKLYFLRFQFYLLKLSYQGSKTVRQM